MGEAREMARKIRRQQEELDIKLEKQRKLLGEWAVTLIAMGAVIASCGLAFDQTGIIIVGSILMVFGAVSGIFWAVNRK
jgi:hypothetical protein